MRSFQIVVWSYKALEKPDLADLKLDIMKGSQQNIRRNWESDRNIHFIRAFKPANGKGFDALARLKLLLGTNEFDVQDDIEDVMLACFQFGLLFALNKPDEANQLRVIDSHREMCEDLIARADNAPIRVRQAKEALDSVLE